MNIQRTPAQKKAQQLAKYLREERPDYNYLKSVFRHLRTELEVEVPKAQNKLPNIPSEEEIKRYYDAVWQARNVQDMVIIKTLLYTGVRVSELVNIKLENVDFERCQIRINDGKGGRTELFRFQFHLKKFWRSTLTRCLKKRRLISLNLLGNENTVPEGFIRY